MRSRAATIRDLARAARDGVISFEPGGDPDVLAGQLRAIRGIGEWTTSYVLMRASTDPDAFPATDLGLIKAAGMSAAHLQQHAERWRPWRAYAAMLLWGSLEASGG